MTSPPLYLLDTNILVHLCRNDRIGLEVASRYQLSELVLRPAICVVTIGELYSFARLRNWGEEKLKKMTDLLEQLVAVDIGTEEVLRAYAELEYASQRLSGTSRNMGKNDLWIAAVARVSGGILLTTDKDFDHLHPKWINVEYVDSRQYRK